MLTQTLSHSESPREQARREHRVSLGTSEVQLSDRDQAALKAILDGRREFVPHPLFNAPDAEKQIFNEATSVQRPDTSWYHPLMERLDTADVRQARNAALKPAQERALFLQYNYCRFKVSSLCAQITQGRVPADLARRILAWHRKAEAYQDQIIQSNLALVLAMVQRTRLSQVDFAELVSEGNMALMRTVAKFDVSRGFKFSTYACRAIIKAFWRASQKLSRYREFFPTEFDPELERSDFKDVQRQTHDEECAAEIRQIVRNNRAALTDLEQEVIERRFALGLNQLSPAQADTGPLTLEQVGKLIGLTKERVRQIQNRALAKLRVTLEGGLLS